jgi:hypothetical protein
LNEKENVKSPNKRSPDTESYLKTPCTILSSPDERPNDTSPCMKDASIDGKLYENTLNNFVMPG